MIRKYLTSVSGKYSKKNQSVQYREEQNFTKKQKVDHQEDIKTLLCF